MVTRYSEQTPSEEGEYTQYARAWLLNPNLKAHKINSAFFGAVKNNQVKIVELFLEDHRLEIFPEGIS